MQRVWYKRKEHSLKGEDFRISIMMILLFWSRMWNNWKKWSEMDRERERESKLLSNKWQLRLLTSTGQASLCVLFKDHHPSSSSLVSTRQVLLAKALPPFTLPSVEGEKRKFPSSRSLDSTRWTYFKRIYIHQLPVPNPKVTLHRFTACVFHCGETYCPTSIHIPLLHLLLAIKYITNFLNVYQNFFFFTQVEFFNFTW